MLSVSHSPRYGLRSLKLKAEYRTGEGDVAREFYEPCLLAASQYDRAVGYFRSTVFAVVGDAAVRFALNGGRMRFICSPSLTSDDMAALAAGYENRQAVVARRVREDVEALISDTGVAGPAQLLATLIASETLDLRIAVRPPALGIYHEKLGIFSDENGDAASFKGSSNETWSAWHPHGNVESFEVFLSWTSDSHRVARHREYFDRLWSGDVPAVETIPFPEAARRLLCEIAHDDLESCLMGRVGTQHAPEVDTSAAKRPMPHQVQAIENWLRAGQRGILRHATGSGKTITATIAISRHTREGKPAVVLVPSQLLLRQWKSELSAQMPNATILLAGAGENAWRQPGRLEAFAAHDASLGQRIILATMQTARKREFSTRLRHPSSLLVVADEVHQIGSQKNAEFLMVEAGARLGLSATPERYGDPAGTDRLFAYFGPVVEPVITLNDAISAGRLVPYEYHAHPVSLTANESEDWERVTREISLEAARGPRDREGKPTLTERAKLLLIQRARIAKRANNKLQLACGILKAEFRPEQRWLVYCEDRDQLSSVLQSINSLGLPAAEFYSDMPGDKEATLAWLRKYGGIVVSIRCLDEGVDIPEVSHALILASSQNPRQFIQRRGRVLRKSEDKFIAVVHDAIVVPPSLEDEPEQTSLAKAELARALEFASSALNRNGAEEIAAIADRLGIIVGSVTHTGIEDTDEPTE